MNQYYSDAYWRLWVASSQIVERRQYPTHQQVMAAL